MKHARFAGLLSSLAVVGITCCGYAAQAAECELTINGSHLDQTITYPSYYYGYPWHNYVTIESTSKWNATEAHYNNLSAGVTYSRTNPGYTGVPSGGGYYPFDIQFQGNGTYECYVIDTGNTNYGTPNIGDWADSTNHIMVTVAIP